MKKHCFLMVFMFITFTFFSSQAFAQSFSGQITYAGTSTNHILIGYAPTAGPSCATADWSLASYTDAGAASFPAPFNYAPVNVAAGTYCIAAFLDNAPTGTPPDLTDPFGVYTTLGPGTITPVNIPGPGDTPNINIQLYDSGPLIGIWNVSANVAIGAPVNQNCVYRGPAGIYNFDSLVGGKMTLTSSSPFCSAPPYSPIDVVIMCDTLVANSLSNCVISGVPGGPYFPLTGTISPDGNFANGSFAGSFQQTSFNVSWSANRQGAAIPTLTEWGMIIFIVLAGLGYVYYIRRRKRAES